MVPAVAEKRAEVTGGVIVIYFTVPGERMLEQLERFGTEVLPRVSSGAGPAAAAPSAWRT